jgi:hypothetical protein
MGVDITFFMVIGKDIRQRRAPSFAFKDNAELISIPLVATIILFSFSPYVSDRHDINKTLHYI